MADASESGRLEDLSVRCEEPIQGIAFFSTRGGQYPPRPAPFPRPEPIVRSDIRRDRNLKIDQLRNTWPHVCNSIFAPWDIRWFFDEYDFVVCGGSFLYSVIQKMMEENQMNVETLSRDWSEKHRHRFEVFRHIHSGDFDVFQAFHEQDIANHGVIFLRQVLRLIAAAYQKSMDLMHSEDITFRGQALVPIHEQGLSGELAFRAMPGYGPSSEHVQLNGYLSSPVMSRNPLPRGVFISGNPAQVHNAEDPRAFPPPVRQVQPFEQQINFDSHYGSDRQINVGYPPSVPVHFRHGVTYVPPHVREQFGPRLSFDHPPGPPGYSQVRVPSLPIASRTNVGDSINRALQSSFVQPYGGHARPTVLRHPQDQEHAQHPRSNSTKHRKGSVTRSGRGSGYVSRGSARRSSNANTEHADNDRYAGGRRHYSSYNQGPIGVNENLRLEIDNVAEAETQNHRSEAYPQGSKRTLDGTLTDVSGSLSEQTMNEGARNGEILHATEDTTFNKSRTASTTHGTVQGNVQPSPRKSYRDSQELGNKPDYSRVGVDHNLEFWVLGFERYTTESEIREVLAPVGTVATVRGPMLANENATRTFAYIRFTSADVSSNILKGVIPRIFYRDTLLRIEPSHRGMQVMDSNGRIGPSLPSTPATAYPKLVTQRSFENLRDAAKTSGSRAVAQSASASSDTETQGKVGQARRLTGTQLDSKYETAALERPTSVVLTKPESEHRTAATMEQHKPAQSPRPRCAQTAEQGVEKVVLTSQPQSFGHAGVNHDASLHSPQSVATTLPLGAKNTEADHSESATVQPQTQPGTVQQELKAHQIIQRDDLSSITESNSARPGLAELSVISSTEEVSSVASDSRTQELVQVVATKPDMKQHEAIKVAMPVQAKKALAEHIRSTTSDGNSSGNKSVQQIDASSTLHDHLLPTQPKARASNIVNEVDTPGTTSNNDAQLAQLKAKQKSKKPKRNQKVSKPGGDKYTTGDSTTTLSTDRAATEDLLLDAPLVVTHSAAAEDAASLDAKTAEEPVLPVVATDALEEGEVDMKALGESSLPVDALDAIQKDKEVVSQLNVDTSVESSTPVDQSGNSTPASASEISRSVVLAGHDLKDWQRDYCTVMTDIAKVSEAKRSALESRAESMAQKFQQIEQKLVSAAQKLPTAGKSMRKSQNLHRKKNTKAYNDLLEELHFFLGEVKNADMPMLPETEPEKPSYPKFDANAATFVPDERLHSKQSHITSGSNAPVWGIGNELFNLVTQGAQDSEPSANEMQTLLANAETFDLPNKDGDGKQTRLTIANYGTPGQHRFLVAFPPDNRERDGANSDEENDRSPTIVEDGSGTISASGSVNGDEDQTRKAETSKPNTHTEHTAEYFLNWPERFSTAKRPEDLGIFKIQQLPQSVYDAGERANAAAVPPKANPKPSFGPAIPPTSQESTSTLPAHYEDWGQQMASARKNAVGPIFKANQNPRSQGTSGLGITPVFSSTQGLSSRSDPGSSLPMEPGNRFMTSSPPPGQMSYAAAAAARQKLASATDSDRAGREPARVNPARSVAIPAIKLDASRKSSKAPLSRGSSSVRTGAGGTGPGAIGEGAGKDVVNGDDWKPGPEGAWGAKGFSLKKGG